MAARATTDGRRPAPRARDPRRRTAGARPTPTSRSRFQTDLAGDAEHHLLAPVGLGHIEPECRDAIAQRGGASIADQTDMKLGAYCSAPASGDAQREAEIADGANSSRGRGMHLQQEDGERHEEQDHRQVVAERARVDRKEDRQPPLSSGAAAKACSASRHRR